MAANAFVQESPAYNPIAIDTGGVVIAERIRYPGEVVFDARKVCGFVATGQTLDCKVNNASLGLADRTRLRLGSTCVVAALICRQIELAGRSDILVHGKDFNALRRQCSRFCFRDHLASFRRGIISPNHLPTALSPESSLPLAFRIRI